MVNSTVMTWLYFFITEFCAWWLGLQKAVGLAILPKVHSGAFSGQGQGWKTPRGPAGGALLLCVCSDNALLSKQIYEMW